MSHVPDPIVIVGGGPAAIAAIATMRQRGDDRPMILVDGSEHHVVQPRLHESGAWGEIRVPFEQIADTYQLEFVHSAWEVSETVLLTAEKTGAIKVSDKRLPFSQLLIAVGAKPHGVDAKNGLNLEALRQSRLQPVTGRRQIVGGGPSAVQFAAERAAQESIEILTDQARLLTSLPQPIADYATEQLEQAGVAISTGVRVKSGSPETLWLTGVRAAPPLTANRHGQIRLGQRVLSRVFGAGDCCQYDGSGLNALSAQAAVRKGKLAGRNMLRQHQDRYLLEYDYRERGYIVSLGPDDAVGWMGTSGNRVSGKAAVLAAKALDEQYALLLRGVDLFI